MVSIFWSFRVMVAAGCLVIFISLLALLAFKNNKIVSSNALLKVLFWTLPLPYLANSTGWFVAEAGRQPWLVYGLQTTADGVSRTVTAGEVWTTIIGFTLVYIFAAIAALYLAVEHIKKGPDGNHSHDVVAVKEEATLWN